MQSGGPGYLCSISEMTIDINGFGQWLGLITFLKLNQRNMRNNILGSEDSVTKISRSKSRNQVTAASKLKQKESGWNQRFHLDHIPEYNYQNEPHSQYLKNKFRIPPRKNDPSKAKRLHEPSLQKNKVSNKPNPRRNQQKLKQAITNAFSELKSLWYSKAIPECHMEAMTKIFNRENNPMKIFEDIKHEYSQISKDISVVQKLTESISTRQNCLEQIYGLMESFENADRPKITKLFQQKISHLRILTIHCIQCIVNWREYVETLASKMFKVKYIHNGQLYTSKVKADYQKIVSSNFKQIYKFDTKKTDAFFLNYTVDGKKIMNVSKNLIKRIRVCQIMLNEDTEHLPTQEQKQLTPTIEKLKTPPRQGDNRDNRDKSVPPRGKTPVAVPWNRVPVEYGQLNEYVSDLLSKSEFKDSFIGQIQLNKFEQVTAFRYSETEQEIILGVDKMASQRKIVISVIKSTLEGVEKLLKGLCEYLWEHDYCTEIRVSLVHRKIGQTFSVDPELEKKLKLVGFRWACVNHSGDIRITIYAMKRPLDTVAHKTSRRTQTYPVIIQHLINFSLIERKEKKYPSRCFSAALDLIRSVQEYQKQDYEELCRRDQFSHHLQCIKKVAEYVKKEEGGSGQPYFSYSGMKSFFIQNEQTRQKVFRNVEISSKRAKTPSVISLVNTCFKFKHITIQDGKYTKFFPNKDNEILIVQSNYPIYLLQTDEQNINFFVIEVSEGFSMESVQSIFNGMGEQSSFIDEFWLPIFYKCEDYIDEVGFPSTQIVSTNYRNSLGSLVRKSKIRTKIIKPPFVFGMINKKLLEMLEIPFYCTLVRKEDLI